jgi:hypothetical protein
MIALKTHPDKSGLNIEYFLFFMDAYKALAKVYYFRTKRKDTNFSNKYENEIDDDKYKLLKSLDGKSAKEFNEWFNKMFDKVKINDEEMDFGYEKWYRENEEVKQNKVSLSEFGREFEKRKKECKKIIVHRGVRELKNESGYNLTRNRPVEYSSDIFSKLPFEDLKKAHTETVIPVTHEDFENKPKFDSVNKYIQHRDKQDTQPLSLQQSKRYLSELSEKKNEMNMRRAYALVKRDMEIEDCNKKWWGNLKLLKD